MEIRNIKRTVIDGDLECTESQFNSNNGWGFGGAYGTQWQFDKNIVMKVARACYRHTGTSPFITVWKDGDKLFDEAGHSKKNRAAAIALVRELLNTKS